MPDPPLLVLLDPPKFELLDPPKPVFAEENDELPVLVVLAPKPDVAELPAKPFDELAPVAKEDDDGPKPAVSPKPVLPNPESPNPKPPLDPPKLPLLPAKPPLLPPKLPLLPAKPPLLPPNPPKLLSLANPLAPAAVVVVVVVVVVI